MILKLIPTKYVFRKKRYKTKNGIRVKGYMERRLVLNKTLRKNDYYEYYVIRGDFLDNLLKVCDKYMELETEYEKEIKRDSELGKRVGELMSKIIEVESERDCLKEEREILIEMFAEHLSKCLKIDKDQAKALVEHDLEARLLERMKHETESR